MADFDDIPRIPRVRIAPATGGLLRWAALVLGTLVAAYAIWSSVTVTIPPWEVAVRQVYVGPSKGIQEAIYGPGLHLVVPGYERLHAFPRDLRLLEFNDDNLSSSEGSSLAPAIRIQTSEGYQVKVDVAIAYRIVDPFMLFKAVGPGNLYETALMVPRSDKFLRQKLGELNAEQFYLGHLRRKKAEETAELLAADVAPAGIQVWSVMVRHYTYDDRYQEAIEQRKIQDQTVFKNRAESVAASHEAEKNRVLAEGQASVDVAAEHGRAEVKMLESDADLYYRKQIAEGDLLVALAEAEGTRLESQALMAGGADNLVGMKMAQVMSGTSVIVVPTSGPGAVNPLDLDSLIRGW